MDIWSLDAAGIAANRRLMNSFLDKLNGRLRRLILEYKYSILNEDGRTPSLSGYYIYEAVLNKGYRDFADITDYLVKNQVKIIDRKGD